MGYHSIAFFSGFLLDLVLGDPYWLPHPVRLIGALIAGLEKRIRKWGKKNVNQDTMEFWQGAGLVLIVTTSVGTGAFVLLFLAYRLHPYAGMIVEAIMTYQILAVKCLRVESMKVYQCLKEGDLAKARTAVSMIVGRDTACLDEAGIARGTLYYHFKSKEDILDAMIERMTGSLVAKASEIVENKDVPVLQRLTLMMMALNVNNDLGHEIMEQIHKPQNALMHQKMQERLLAGVNPIVTRLIEEGIAQGICRTDYPAEVAEMTLLYSNTVFDALAPLGAEERQRKIAAFIYNLERLLGMEEGSLREAILPIFG